MWGATLVMGINYDLMQFQSTHPVWGATPQDCLTLVIDPISIHAPGVGCDVNTYVIRTFFQYFNPRTPCGVRPLRRYRIGSGLRFQSTHPVWGATCSRQTKININSISIHAPRVGCDDGAMIFLMEKVVFQSTHPVWGATTGP